MTLARSIRVRGVVQGVGFRPFVLRLARANALAGWVLNEESGVDIHLEGPEKALDAFLYSLKADPPPAARISAVDVHPSEPVNVTDFTIRQSRRASSASPPTVRISPDLPICDDCLQELFDSGDPRYLYPYINCTNCGPRYTVIERLPYDRSSTTMRHWALDPLCASEYHDPTNRRFHAQPVACPTCGPHYHLESADNSIEAAAGLLNAGAILAIKGIGGYHLACDARNAEAVRSLRERKFRKEKPFAVMVRTVEIARSLAILTPEAETLLMSTARPIVLVPAKGELPGVAPDNREIGLMLPYAPLHHLLFAAGAPNVLVMTSANRSSEPIAYRDDEACERLRGIADSFLIGARPIARRVDDSVARAGTLGPAILRRSRGYAPAAVATLPIKQPILAVGADLKNAVTLVVDGQAFVSQHIGDLDHYESRESFHKTIQDLVSMYELDWDSLLVVHDCHPEYASTLSALEFPAREKYAVQHHRAHIASVLAEREAWDRRVIGVCFDGAGYGDDGSVWGGEIFRGSVRGGFERVMHVRKAGLAGGDAAARYPVQCAAGFLAEIDGLPDVTAPPFGFTSRYRRSLDLVRKGVRTFHTTSVGRLFDAAAALTGFTREISFEGQAAMWLEHIARAAETRDAYPFPLAGDELDFRPLLAAVAHDRTDGRDPGEIARAFHKGVAEGVCRAVKTLCDANGIDTVVLSGGVFQNELLLENLKSPFETDPIHIWTNAAVPPNDGGVSLGQAALAAFRQSGKTDA
jgi:hydrogenase maturation protein HypF